MEAYWNRRNSSRREVKLNKDFGLSWVKGLANKPLKLTPLTAWRENVEYLMTSRKTQTLIRPPVAFQNIMERALTGGADSVMLEWVPEGLEVTWRVGNTGLGTVVKSNEGNRIIRFIVRAAGLERLDRGVLDVQIAGQSREVSVESYEHFGEWAYRLRVVPIRKRRRT